MRCAANTNAHTHLEVTKECCFHKTAQCWINVAFVECLHAIVCAITCVATQMNAWQGSVSAVVHICAYLCVCARALQKVYKALTQVVHLALQLACCCGPQQLFQTLCCCCSRCGLRLQNRWINQIRCGPPFSTVAAAVVCRSTLRAVCTAGMAAGSN